MPVIALLRNRRKEKKGASERILVKGLNSRTAHAQGEALGKSIIDALKGGRGMRAAGGSNRLFAGDSHCIQSRVNVGATASSGREEGGRCSVSPGADAEDFSFFPAQSKLGFFLTRSELVVCAEESSALASESPFSFPCLGSAKFCC